MKPDINPAPTSGDSQAGQPPEFPLAAGSPISREEKERERCRKKMAIYRQKYPGRVKATKQLQRQQPGYIDKCRAQRRRWLEKKGHKFWDDERRTAHMRKIGEEYRSKETQEQRAARLAGAHTPEARAAQKAAMLAKGPNAPTALFWSLISPDGVAYKFKNLAAFIRENSHLFTKEQLRPVNKHGRTRIEAAIATLSPRRKHCVEHCCGWRWNIDGQTPASYLANT